MKEVSKCPYTNLKSKMKEYINLVLRPKREEYGGMPVCPFAGPELDQGKLMIDIFDPSKSSFLDKMKEFHESKFSSALFAHVKNTNVSGKDTRYYQSFLNKMLKANGYSQYKIICFNSNDTSTEVDGFNPRKAVPAFLINVADKKELSKAHKIMVGTKYFDKMSERYKKYLKV